tara:strand:+ start:756 stop:1319 length:564 start_codon:yes stop_codon:yes gene_type:complete
MIKQAEINAAYQQGVHAALIKLANKGSLEKLYENQKGVAANIGLGGQGLTRNQALMPADLAADATDAQQAAQAARIAEIMKSDKAHAMYNPMNYATMENLSRAGMLGGAGAGTYLGGMDPRAAAMASAGALGGGMIGGNLGQGLGMAYDAWQGDKGTKMDPNTLRQLMAGGGALGGAAGGIGAGLYG